MKVVETMLSEECLKKIEKEDKIRSFQDAKCDAYIAKPIDRKELVKVVKWLAEGVV